MAKTNLKNPFKSLHGSLTPGGVIHRKNPMQLRTPETINSSRQLVLNWQILLHGAKRPIVQLNSSKWKNCKAICLKMCVELTSLLIFLFIILGSRLLKYSRITISTLMHNLSILTWALNATSISHLSSVQQSIAL